MDVGAHLQILLRGLAAMKDICGPSLQSAMDVTVKSQNQVDDDDVSDNDDSNSDIILKSQAIVKKPSKKNKKDFKLFRKQFLQGLNDNIKERFPDNLLKQADVLDYTTWPEDDLSRALYGDAEILELANAVRLNVSLFT